MTDRVGTEAKKVAKAQKQYAEPLPNFLTRMLIDISAAWKTFDAGTSADLYSRELTALANEYGRDRVQAGILKAIRTEKEYCPTPAKLREHIQNAESGGKMIGVTDPRCEACSGTGWKFKQGENPQRYVERCHCWHKELTA